MIEQPRADPALDDRLARGQRRTSDKARLRDWRATFVAALAAARKAGHAAEIAREGALLDPDAALGGRPSRTACTAAG